MKSTMLATDYEFDEYNYINLKIYI